MESEALSELREWATRRLSEVGQRLTPSRERLLMALAASDGPLSLLPLLDQAGSAVKPLDRVALHRALKALEQCGVIHRLTFTGGYCLCRLPEDRGCHHHLICSGCGRTEEVPCAGTASVVAAVAAASGYTLESHRIEFAGLCQSCQ